MRDKKIKAAVLRQIRVGKKTKTEIARQAGITQKTLYAWINGEKQEILSLPPQKKVKLWERESLQDLELAALARDSLRETIINQPAKVANDTKRAIMHSASVVAGIKLDKARLLAGESTENVSIHADILALKSLESGEKPLKSDTIEGDNDDNLPPESIT